MQAPCTHSIQKGKHTTHAQALTLTAHKDEKTHTTYTH